MTLSELGFHKVAALDFRRITSNPGLYQNQKLQRMVTLTNKSINNPDLPGHVKQKAEQAQTLLLDALVTKNLRKKIMRDSTKPEKRQALMAKLENISQRYLTKQNIPADKTSWERKVELAKVQKANKPSLSIYKHLPLASSQPNPLQSQSRISSSRRKQWRENFADDSVWKDIDDLGWPNPNSTTPGLDADIRSGVEAFLKKHRGG